MNDENLTLFGEIRLLQIQLEALIVGVRPDRRYRPEPLRQVDTAALGPRGMIARIDGGWVLDRHHLDHPANGDGDPARCLSIGFTSHYDEMTDRFGGVKLGIGGENLIVATHRRIRLDDLARGVVIRTAHGDIRLDGVAVAAPCVPFTKHLLGDDDAPADDVKEGRRFLDNGTRGYVMALGHLTETVAIAAGDRVFAVS